MYKCLLRLNFDHWQVIFLFIMTLRVLVTKDHIVMAKQPGQSISKAAALVRCSWSAVGNQRQSHGRPRLTGAQGEWRLARVDDISTDHSGAHADPRPVPKAQRHARTRQKLWNKVGQSNGSCFLLHHVDGCVLLTWGAPGSRMHCEKKASQQRLVVWMLLWHIPPTLALL